MDPTQPWITVTGEKDPSEPYRLDPPLGETTQSWDSCYPCPIFRGEPGFFSYQSAPSHVQTKWTSSGPSESQQYSYHELLDTQTGPLAFGIGHIPPAFPQMLAAQPNAGPIGLPDPSFELRSHLLMPFHCFWTGCKAKTKSFLLSTDLAHHIQTYHLHQCPWPTCSTQKPFRRRSDLTRHLASGVHSGNRRYRCLVQGCGKAYSRSDKLAAHKRTHGIADSSTHINTGNQASHATGHAQGQETSVTGLGYMPRTPGLSTERDPTYFPAMDSLSTTFPVLFHSSWIFGYHLEVLNLDLKPSSSTLHR